MKDKRSHVLLGYRLKIIRIFIAALVGQHYAIACCCLPTHGMVGISALVETNFLILPAQAAILRLQLRWLRLLI